MAQLMQKPRILAAGEGELIQMLTHTFVNKVTAEDTNNAWVMHEITDTADHGAPLHTHPWEETFYILEGELHLQVGGRKVVATPGASIYIPADVAHGFQICSPTARILIILPAFAEAFYREAGEKITSLPSDLETFQGICNKYGVQLFL
jgi:quercetin dioxygenase-like cupin family protein